MSIHTFGDSHCYFGWNGISKVRNHHLGPKLCYSFGIDEINIKNFAIKENDTVIFSFGEIDCRCHVHKYVFNDQDYKKIINILIVKYFNKIKECSIKFNIKAIIYNVVPPVQKNKTLENKNYPFLGEDEDRKKYVLYFNEQLKKQCKKNNLVFFNVYNDYVDNNGYLSEDLSDGHVHINDGYYIEKFLRKIIKII